MAEIKFRFQLNPRPNREGLCEIFLVVSDRGKRQSLKTDVNVKNEHFGVFKNILTEKGKKINKRVLVPGKWITSKDSEAVYKNDLLFKKMDEFKKAYQLTIEKDLYVNKEAVIKAVEHKYALIDVIAVFDRKIKELADDYPNERQYIGAKNHLLAFLKKEKNTDKIDFRHMDAPFLKKFEKYLFDTIQGGKPSDATVYNIMKRMKAINNYAIKHGIITPDIYHFRLYTMPQIKPKFKERLTIEEIRQFEAVKYEKDSLIFHSQNIFMLALRMAGTRIGDMLNLRVNNIKGGRITFNMSKGNTRSKLMSFKITENMQGILKHYITKKSAADDLIFPFLPPAIDTFSNKQFKMEINRKTSLVNKYLKKIGEDACIPKSITTHISRHSFATAARTMKVDIKSLSEGLGHTTTKMTENYLAVLDIESLDEMMEKVGI